MKYHSYFFRKLEKMSQNLSAAVVLGALRVKCDTIFSFQNNQQIIQGMKFAFQRMKVSLSFFIASLCVSIDASIGMQGHATCWSVYISLCQHLDSG